MGLFNVIKLANDYNKAKKLLENKKITVEDAKKLIERIKEFVDYLYKLKDELSNFISKVKETIVELKKIKEVL